MGSLANYAESALVQHITMEAAYTSVATVYLCLCTADPTDAATGASMNEVANSGNYARTAIAFGAAASRRITQNATTTFPLLSGALGTATHWAIADTNTYGSGNMLMYDNDVEDNAVGDGDTVQFPDGDFDFSQT